jgi:hypothetical protein
VTTFNLYRQAQLAAWLAQVDWNSDNIVVTQHTSSYTPSLDANAHVSDLTGEVATGNGYTQGGAALDGRAAAYHPAASWPDTWAASAAYAVGAVVRPASSPVLLYRCSAAGTSGATAPAWPQSPGLTVTDGSVTWDAVGAGAVALTADVLTWEEYSATFRYLVISDRTPDTAAAQPLLAVADAGSSVTGSGGSLTVTFDSGTGSGIVIPLWAP